MNGCAYLKNLQQVYFAVTNQCNLHCGYCYAIERNQGPQFFPTDAFKRIVDAIAFHAHSEHIEIIFHGGEPLLAPPKFFRDCMEYAAQVLEASHKTADFGIQSNLTLMTDEMLSLMERFNMSVSTSIDGPEAIHNAARQRWQTTMDWMKKIKSRGLKVSPIAVCSKHNHRLIGEIFAMFDAMDVRHTQVNIATSNVSLVPGSSFTPLTADEIFDVYQDILKYSLQYHIKEEKMSQMIRHYFGLSVRDLKALGCGNPFCHAGSTMIVFAPDGKMYPCSPCVSLAAHGQDYSLGTFGDPAVDDNYFASLQRFHEKSEHYMTECQQCAAANICEFDCPGYDRIDPVTRQNKCEAIKKFYAYLRTMDRDQLMEAI